MQLKYGLGNTASGTLNRKQTQGKYKQIDLDDMDIQMISPQFLQSKTLKKPLKQYGIQFQSTNTNFIKAENDKTQKNAIPGNFNYQPLKSIEEFNINLNKTQKIDYTFISLSDTAKIKPAYRPVEQDSTLKHNQPPAHEFSIDDNNTIFSAISKKGSKPKKSITFADNKNILQQSNQAQFQKKAGKAQNRLKQLFNKNVTRPSIYGTSQTVKVQLKKHNKNQDIEQQIQESINSYGDEEFEKYSQESGAIKQSIRQQFAASSGSGFIKQSIRQSIGNSSGGKPIKSEIMEEIQQSIRSASKGQIPQFINSYKSSSANIRQDIAESLSGSRKSGQEVYEQIFQEYEDSLKNSRGAFKKSSNFKDSDVLSKSFRKKTNVIKSIKIAEQINFQTKVDVQNSWKKQQGPSDKYSNQLLQQKKSLKKKKADISQMLQNKDVNYKIQNKNKNLIYEFKIQLNKLLTSENFQTKLRKLTSFINFGQNDTKNQINSLEDNILRNLLEQIQKIKSPAHTADQIKKIREEYDQKLNFMLKDQQINLRVQMENKLHLQQMELKTMIAELQKKFEGKAFTTAKINANNNAPSSSMVGSGLYEAESDYSIDSDNVSWKADLWETLPEYQKKKLYQKQTKQVTNFLTEIMINQLKQESLCRDLDISFQFPDDGNSQNQKSSVFPSFNRPRSVQSSEDFMPKSTFNRKQFGQNISLSPSTKKESVFPDFPRPQPKIVHNILDLNKKQKVNQYTKVQGQTIVEHSKKLKMQKQRVVQILSKYKSSYLRKKNDVVRKIIKIVKPKQTNKNSQNNIASVIQQITILNKQEIDQNDLIYVRAFEQQLIWSLVSIITKNQNMRTSSIEDLMKKNYDRILVLCQVKAAQQSSNVVCLNIYEDDQNFNKLKGNVHLMSTKQCPLQTGIRQEALQIIENRQQKVLKNQLVQNIMSILMSEFAKEFPKRKK